jgi:triacylglycerol lipase
MNIVLVPGVLGFNRFHRMEYFNGVPQHLRRTLGVNVLSTTTAPLGTIEHRAELLAQQILDAGFDPSQPVHILAHSMGGLDTRFLIAKNLRGVAPRIASLTAIGTPHFGSPVATLLDKANLFTAFPNLGAQSEFIDELRENTNAVHDLSEATAREFNEECPDDPRVRYFEVVGVGRQGRLLPVSALLLPTFAIVSHHASGKSDGVVPVSSATREGTRKPIAEWPGDHADLIGHNLDSLDLTGPPVFPYLERYEELVRRLMP